MKTVKNAVRLTDNPTAKNKIYFYGGFKNGRSKDFL